MRTLAWFLLILLIAATVLITLGATNYVGIGDAIGTSMQSSVIAPTRNWVVTTWLFIGTSGWYILATLLGISIVGGIFMTIIVYGLFWQKLIQQKLLHKITPEVPLASMQRTTTTTITPPEPATTSITPAIEGKKEETT